MHVKVFDTVSDVAESEWDAVVGNSRLIARHAFLRAVEGAEINDCRHFYPVLFDQQGIAAHASAYAITTELDAFAKGWARRGIDAVRKAWPRFLSLRTTECGSPVALGTTLSVRKDVDTRSACEKLVDAIEVKARTLNTSVLLFRDFHDGNVESVDFLPGRGYRELNNLPGAELTIRWETFEEYLASMRSRYRNKIRAQMRHFDKPEVQTELVADFSDLTEDLERLWRAAYDNATEYRREVLTKRFFNAMNCELGDRSAVLLFTVKGRPSAFSLLIFDDETLIPLFCGMDYGLNSKYSLYFNLLYGAVRVAIERRMKHVDFGITTLFPKIHLGCRVVPQIMYMKHLNPILNPAVSGIFRLSTPSDEIAEPQVFKT